MTLSTLLILAVYMNLVPDGLACHESVVPQWFVHPTSVWNGSYVRFLSGTSVICSIPVGGAGHMFDSCRGPRSYVLFQSGPPVICSIPVGSPGHMFDSCRGPRSYVRFLSGTPGFSLSHARDMMNISLL